MRYNTGFRILVGMIVSTALYLLIIVPYMTYTDVLVHLDVENFEHSMTVIDTLVVGFAALLGLWVGTYAGFKLP